MKKNTKVGFRLNKTVALVALAAVLTAGGIAVNRLNNSSNENDKLLDLNENGKSSGDIVKNNEQLLEEKTEISETEIVDEYFGMDNVMDATDEYIDEEKYKVEGYQQQAEKNQEEEIEVAANNENEAAANNETDNNTEVASEAADNGQAANEVNTAEVTSNAVANSLNFTEDSELMWPVNGNVILNYNMDSMVYFATLEQYKYNPAIIIQGDVGDKVYSVADGVIENIYEDSETGTTAVMNLGNGYKATYGQLQNMDLSIGSIVKKGDTIGEVANPTMYYSIEGSNLYFKMEKDGQAVDPLNYLE